jgi:hypothetical protein
MNKETTSLDLCTQVYKLRKPISPDVLLLYVSKLYFFNFICLIGQKHNKIKNLLAK